MNLENVENVKSRIEYIERRFARFDRTYRSGQGYETGKLSFSQALKTAGGGSRAECPDYLEPIIAKAADKYNLDPALIKSVINRESGFRPTAVSRVGAMGLMQLMPSTAQSMGIDPLDVRENIDGGARYLRAQIDRFGSLESALAAYNAGPGAVARYGGVPPYTETQNFVSGVIRDMEFYNSDL